MHKSLLTITFYLEKENMWRSMLRKMHILNRLKSKDCVCVLHIDLIIKCLHILPKICRQNTYN